MEYQEQTCSECGDTFNRIGSHWSQSSCGYPSISSETKEIIAGLLMGDGCVSRKDNPYLIVQCTQEEYLLELDELFGELSSGSQNFMYLVQN